MRDTNRRPAVPRQLLRTLATVGALIGWYALMFSVGCVVAGIFVPGGTTSHVLLIAAGYATVAAIPMLIAVRRS